MNLPWKGRPQPAFAGCRFFRHILRRWRRDVERVKPAYRVHLAL